MGIEKVKLLFLEHPCDIEFELVPALPSHIGRGSEDSDELPEEAQRIEILNIVAHYGNDEEIDILPLLSEYGISLAIEAVDDILDEAARDPDNDDLS